MKAAGGLDFVTWIQAPVDNNTAMNKPFEVQSMPALQSFESPFLLDSFLSS